MTNLKEVNFGLNQYCGPAVLSALTGESTDRCAAVISTVSGRDEIKAVSSGHLKEALRRLKFDVKETPFNGSTLYGSLFRMHTHDGIYVIFVPKHVVAVEIKNNEIYICDNHTKTPIDIKQSARLTQKVELVWKVTPHPLPVLVKREIRLCKMNNNIQIQRLEIYKNEEDNVLVRLGQFIFQDRKELEDILYKIHSFYESGEFER